MDGSWHRRDEPAWHDPNILLTLANDVGASNLSDVRSAISGGFTVFSDLPVFRNFYAHRNPRSLRAAADLAPSYGIAASLRPTQILLSRPPSSPQLLIHEWFDELLFNVEFLCD
jgi:hypothetical protein